MPRAYSIANQAAHEQPSRAIKNDRGPNAPFLKVQVEPKTYRSHGFGTTAAESESLELVVVGFSPHLLQ